MGKASPGIVLLAATWAFLWAWGDAKAAATTRPAFVKVAAVQCSSDMGMVDKN